MNKGDDLAQKIRDLKRDAKRLAREAAEQVDPDGSTARVNVAGRKNVVAATNIGSEGSTHVVSSRQRSRIRQDGAESYEETESATFENVDDQS